MVSIQVLATAMSGLARSASLKPTALYMERAPARLRRWLGVGFVLVARQPRHHRAQLGADFLNRVLLFALAHRRKVLAAFFVLFDPLFGKAAVLDARQHFLHRLARLIADNFLAAGQIAI